jgi:hypothetical protein
MFLVRWTTWLASLPFAWVGRALAMLKSPLCVPFVKAAWHVGGRGSEGRLALICVASHEGEAAARALAAGWMQRRARPEIAAFEGLLAAQAGEIERARTCLARGRDLGDDAEGMLELLEMFLAQVDPDPLRAFELAEALRGRRDLSPLVRRCVLGTVMWKAMIRGDADDARRRAEHLLSIDADPNASAVLWALSKRAGRHDLAQTHLGALKGLAAGERLQLMVRAAMAAGCDQELDRLLPALEEQYPQHAERIGRFRQVKEALA